MSIERTPEYLASLPTSRPDAKAMGATRYFTGNPCPYGHVDSRQTANGNCTTCALARAAAYLAKRWAENAEWRVEKTATEKARRHIPEVLAKERPRNADRVRVARATRPEVLEKSKASVRRYGREVRKNDPRQLLMKKAAGRNRHAKKKGSAGTHTADDVQRIHTEQGFTCKVCRCDTSTVYHIDHILALSRGGSNGPENLQILCPPCNMSKGAKTMEEFMVYREMVAANDNAKLSGVQSA